MARYATAAGGLALALVASAALAARPGPKPPPAQGGFSDAFETLDSSRWVKADGWTNGSPFDNAWRADHVTVEGGFLDLRLDDQATLGEPYASGEIRTAAYYGYGCYEAGFRPVARSGAVSSFFTFAGPDDNGGNGRHNEIDIEFLGKDTTRVQLNYWTNDDSYSSRNEVLLDLGFDAAASVHAYGFKWTATGIAWYVDGNLVYQASDSAANPTPKATESLQRIMVNLWPVDATASAWAGTFAYPGTPLHARYDWVRYATGSDCAVTGTPPSPPPAGNPAVLHVQSLSPGLDARSTQVTVKARVVDGLGQGVGEVAVTGAWSGAISSGDTLRKTDASGVATFYSARSRATGTVTFCVVGLAKAGFGYDAAANVETCDSLVK